MESEVRDTSECRVTSLLFVELSIVGYWTLFPSCRVPDAIAIETYPWVEFAVSSYCSPNMPTSGRGGDVLSQGIYEG